MVEERRTKVDINPYEDVDWGSIQRFKTNLHTHTIYSDGRVTPNERVDEYKNQDYDIISLTDHDTMRDHVRLETLWRWVYKEERELGDGFADIFDLIKDEDTVLWSFVDRGAWEV